MAAGRGLETRRQKWRRGPATRRLRLLDDSEARYVSRGGLKLEAALKQVGLSVAGLACLDVGPSTGGFTDCLLQHGARWWWVWMWAVPSCTRACAKTRACCASKRSMPDACLLLI
jgi:hypothetical protein